MKKHWREVAMYVVLYGVFVAALTAYDRVGDAPTWGVAWWGWLVLSAALFSIVLRLYHAIKGSK